MKYIIKAHGLKAYYSPYKGNYSLIPINRCARRYGSKSEAKRAKKTAIEHYPSITFEIIVLDV